MNKLKEKKDNSYNKRQGKNVGRNHPMLREILKIKFMSCIFLDFSGYWCRTEFVHELLTFQKATLDEGQIYQVFIVFIHMQKEYIRMRQLAMDLINFGCETFRKNTELQIMPFLFFLQIYPCRLTFNCTCAPPTHK